LHHRYRLLGTLGLVALAGGILSACSSSPSTSAPKAASTSGSGTAAKATSITIALPVSEPVQSPVYLAQKLGYFRQAGLNVNIVVLAGDTAANAAMIAGSVQYTSVNAVSLLTAAEKGVPVQNVCMEYDGPEWALAVSKSTLSSDHVSKGMGLKQLLVGLHGAKIAIVGSAGSLSLVGVHASSDLASAYSHGEVQALFDTQPTPDEIVKKFGGQVVFDTTQVPSLAQIPWEGIIGTKSYISKNPSINKAVCGAIGKADNYLRQHPSGAVSQLSGIFPNLSPALLGVALRAYRWAPDGRMTAAQWSNGATLLAQLGMIKSAPSASTLSGAFTTKYLPAG
jgi:ABC-type nitrate/sulfonate/bicarbonate transport system substrate-binding protein